jgi:hypothetical protein
MPGHDIHPQQLGGVDHVLAFGPERRRRSLPAVAAIEQQRAGTLRAHALYQRCQVRETADLAVGACGFFEVEIGEGICEARVGADPEVLEHRPADQVRRLAQAVVHAEIDIGLAEISRQQLRVTIGEMHQRHVVAKLAQVI